MAPFRFMDLPKEIRAMIIREAIGDIYPNVVWNDGNSGVKALTVTLGHGYANHPDSLYQFEISRFSEDCYDIEAGCITFTPNFNICFLNKAIYREAMENNWVGTIKYFNNSHTFVQVLDTVPGPPYKNWLSKVVLNFTTADYFAFLGLTIDAENDEAIKFKMPCDAYLLRCIPELTTLELRFRNPYDGWETNPWGKLHASYHRPLGTLSAQDAYWLDAGPFHTCHKVLVDTILCFMFGYVRRVPRIRLTGCIKTAVKKHWDAIFEKKVGNRMGQQGLNKEIERICRDTEPGLMPSGCCKCRTMCRTERPHLMLEDLANMNQMEFDYE